MISLAKKDNLMRQVAQYQRQLWQPSQRFNKTGNLYPSDDGTRTIGPIVSMSFFWHNRGSSGVFQGSFHNSHGWLSARLQLICEEQVSALQRLSTKFPNDDKSDTASDIEDDIEDAENIKKLVDDLLETLLEIFPPDEEEETVIFHDNLNKGNILVDTEGENVTALLDWECVSTFSLWSAAEFPSFLECRMRDDEPNRSDHKYDPEMDHGRSL